MPRLPAVEKGYIKRVNFGDFPIDKQSIGSIIEGISSKTCQLESMRVSIATLKSLDFESCHSLGAFLYRKKINVSISQIVDSNEILKMFRILDNGNKGYLNRNEFANAWQILKLQFTSLNTDNTDNTDNTENRGINSSNESGNNNIVINDDCDNNNDVMNDIFDRLAIRRLKYNRDRVYFMDFYDSFTNVNELYQLSYDSKHDITCIDFPIHFVFYYLINCVKNYYLSISQKNINLIKLDELIHLPHNKYQFTKILNNNLIKLFRFSIALRQETQLLDQDLITHHTHHTHHATKQRGIRKKLQSNQNVLITIIIAHFEIANIIAKKAKSFESCHNEDQEGYINSNDNLSKILFWFIFKLTNELLDLSSIRNFNFILSKCNLSVSGIFKKNEYNYQISGLPGGINQRKRLNCLELALVLKNFEYFVIICKKMIENQTNLNKRLSIRKMIENDVVSYQNKAQIMKFAIEHECVELVKHLYSLMGAVFNDKNSNIPQSLIYHAIVGCTTPRRGKMCFVCLLICVVEL